MTLNDNAYKVWTKLQGDEVRRIVVAPDNSPLPQGSCVLQLDGADWLTHDTITAPSNNVLYYRREAADFYEKVILPIVTPQALSNTHRLVVCGSPGIGKSFFLNAIIYNVSQMALKQEKVINVFFESVSLGSILWLQFGPSANPPLEATRYSLDHYVKDFENDNSIYLVDEGTYTATHEPMVVQNATTILASSPQRGNYSGFRTI